MINFIVPKSELLDIENPALKTCCESPGIMVPIIEQIASRQETKSTPFKLSIDLKKLNPGGKFGDVNCMGYEREPTFAQRQERLKREQMDGTHARNFYEQFRTLSRKGLVRNELTTAFAKLVQNLSGRLKALRLLKGKREFALDRLKHEAGPNWKDSNMAFVLSSIQTSLYDITTSVSDVQNTTKAFVNFNAMLGDIGPINSGTVELGKQ